LLVSVELIYKR